MEYGKSTIGSHSRFYSIKGSHKFFYGVMSNYHFTFMVSWAA